MPPSDNPLATSRQIIKEFLRKMTQSDAEASILSWRQMFTLEPLTPSTVLPDTITGMHKYLHKLCVPKKGE